MPKIEKKEELKTEKKTVKEPSKLEKETAQKGKAKKAKVEEKKKNTTVKEKVVKKVPAKKEKAEKPKATKKATVSKEKIVAKSTTKKATKTSLKKNAEEKKEKLSKVVKPKKETKTTKKSTKVAKKKIEEEKKYLPEYYDLPYRYNDTIVKILYQTPKRIFVYWDISDSDRQMYLKAFGEDFFEKTYPVLLVHNEKMNYTFEVPINDFANSWYLDINDTKSKYIVQLGRKFRNVENSNINYDVVKNEKINLQNDFVYITDSNKLETPNDHILFEKMPQKIVFRNVKTGVEEVKEIKQVLKKVSKTYEEPKLEEMYKELYGEEIFSSEEFISNPSSGNPTSSFFK